MNTEINLTLASSHVLRQLDEKCTMDNPCTISTNFGEVLIEQSTNDIFTATLDDLNANDVCASGAFIKLIPMIRNKFTVMN